MAASSSRVLRDCHGGDGGASEPADDDIHGRPSSTQVALNDPPPGAAPVYCPECSLLLVGKVAALIPCGHVHHSHCAEYLTRMARSRGGLCGHCKLRVSGSRVLHLSVDETAGSGDGDDDAAVSGERLEQIKAEVAEVAALQRMLMDEDRRAREEKRREKDLQHQCAALYQQNDVLRRAVASAFGDGSSSSTAVVGASVSAIVAATAAAADTVGGGAARDPTGFAHDPLTSIVQLQQHVMDCVDAERALAGRLAQVNGDFATLGAVIERYRGERQCLAAEKATLRRRVRRRRSMLEPSQQQQQQQPARRQPVPSPVKIEPGSAPPRGVPLPPHHALNRQTAVGIAVGRGYADRRSSGASAAVVVVLSSDDDGSSDAGQVQQQRAAESDAGSDSDVLLVDDVGASSASAGGHLPSGPVRPSATSGASLAPGGLPRPRFGEVPRPRPQQRLL